MQEILFTLGTGILCVFLIAPELLTLPFMIPMAFIEHFTNHREKMLDKKNAAELEGTRIMAQLESKKDV